MSRDVPSRFYVYLAAHASVLSSQRGRGKPMTSSGVQLLYRRIISAVSPFDYQVRFVEKSLRLTSWELVTHLLGNRSDGSSWRMTCYDAIRLAEEGIARFYIMRAGLRVELIVVNNAWGYKCLRAEDDAT